MHVTAGSYRLKSETIALREIEGRKVALILPPGATVVIQNDTKRTNLYGVDQAVRLDF